MQRTLGERFLEGVADADNDTNNSIPPCVRFIAAVVVLLQEATSLAIAVHPQTDPTLRKCSIALNVMTWLVSCYDLHNILQPRGWGAASRIVACAFAPLSLPCCLAWFNIYSSEPLPTDIPAALQKVCLPLHTPIVMLLHLFFLCRFELGLPTTHFTLRVAALIASATAGALATPNIACACIGIAETKISGSSAQVFAVFLAVVQDMVLLCLLSAFMVDAEDSPQYDAVLSVVAIGLGLGVFRTLQDTRKSLGKETNQYLSIVNKGAVFGASLVKALLKSMTLAHSVASVSFDSTQNHNTPRRSPSKGRSQSPDRAAAAVGIVGGAFSIFTTCLKAITNALLPSWLATLCECAIFKNVILLMVRFYIHAAFPFVELYFNRSLNILHIVLLALVGLISLMVLLALDAAKRSASKPETRERSASPVPFDPLSIL